MASSSAKPQYHDVKLESFLSRNLPREDHERLFTSEACVAVVGREKPVHRHAIVGHRRLYLTEAPPKHLRIAVNLQDVEAVRRLDKPPDFLSGKEKDEVVHVQVRYKREAKQEKSMFGSLGDLSPAVLRQLSGTRSGWKSERTSLPSPLLARSSFKSPTDKSMSQKSSFHQSSSTHSLDQLKSPTDKSMSQRSSFHQSSSTHSLDQLKQQRSRSLSPTAMARKSTMERVTTSFHSPPSFHFTSASPGSTRHHIPSNRTADSTHRGKKRSSLETSYRSASRGCSPSRTPNDSSGSVMNVLSTSSLPASSSSIQSSRSSPSLLEETVVSQLSQVSMGSSRSNAFHSSSYSVAFSSERDLREVDISSSEKMERGVLDLYILKARTDFYHQLCAAWEDQKIATTLGTNNIVQSKSLGTVTGDHFSHHFHTLRQELFSATTIEGSAQLTQELCTACQKYFIIKRLFWEDDALLDILVGQLQHQLSGKKGHSCATEIEHKVIVLDLLLQMLRETHSIQQRLTVLAKSSGHYLRLLSTAIVHLLPTLSAEDESFEDELVEKCSGLLRELFRVTHQMKWPLAQRSAVSPEWLVDILAAQPSIRDFCHLLVTHTSSILHMEHLEPQTLVTLHHIACVLHSFVQHSGPLLTLMQTQFAEEFRYFISSSQARQKLPQHIPLSADTVNVLQQTKSKVLRTT